VEWLITANPYYYFNKGVSTQTRISITQELETTIAGAA
jgi:hypothetical protein